MCWPITVQPNSLRTVLLVAILLVVASPSKGQETDKPAKPQAVIDAEKADRDYAFQGEFAGEARPTGDSQKFGLQVIALGDGKFKAVSFSGGLPGAGFDGKQRDELEEEGEFTAVGDRAVVRFDLGDAGRIDVSRKQAVWLSDAGEVAGTLKRVSRSSPTLGAKPPEGARVLFDGSSVEGWKKGRLSPEAWLMEGTTSEAALGSHRLHLEFLLPYKPHARGQARGNSGLYIQGRWEIQMLDSFGLTGEQNECGGLYSVAKPDLNMCLPPLTWQTYDVEFTAEKYDGEKLVSPARITVLHNGVKIHDDVELPHRKSTAAPVDVGAQPGPIYLQNHGNPVRYRNIWAVEK